jgi:hypothetical protein
MLLARTTCTNMQVVFLLLSTVLFHIFVITNYLAMKRSLKVNIRKYLLALVLVAIGIEFIVISDGQLYGTFFGITFFVMAISSILDLDLWIDHLNT